MARHTYANMPNINPSGKDDEMAKTTFRMKKSLLKDVKRFGIDNDMTDTEIFNAALEDWMERQRKKEVRK